MINDNKKMGGTFVVLKSDVHLVLYENIFIPNEDLSPGIFLSIYISTLIVCGFIWVRILEKLRNLVFFLFP